MLAKICEGIPDALAQLKDKGATFLAEYKYDGQRAQIHLLPDGSVRHIIRNSASQHRVAGAAGAQCKPCTIHQQTRPAFMHSRRI